MDSVSRIFSYPVFITATFVPVNKTMKQYNEMKYLRTNIQEIETAAELQKIVNENENVMVCCGRMGPMCIPVYEIMEELEEEVRSDAYKGQLSTVGGYDTENTGKIRK